MSKRLDVSKTLRIVIVDDHQVVREGTRNMLLQHPKIEVVAELASGEELCEILTLRQPDLLLLDINLPGENGLKLLEKLRPQFPTLCIILFSAYNDLAYLRKAKQLQANGYLSKTIDQGSLHRIVFQALESSAFITSDDLTPLLEKIGTENNGLLTPREQEILAEVAKGKTNLAIAETLCVSVKTVDTHVANLMKKLGVNRRTQLATLALEQGLI
ncbi:MAG: response regulator transcription factor [Vampirovibrionales bacterium]|nr:response regulator transcription factor [Vampirovibrionales bacterium]